MPRQSQMRFLKFAIAFAAAVVLLWSLAAVGLYVGMRQPPETFGAIMARMPAVSMMVLPFKPLWMSARTGALQIGDRSPDFELPTLHGERVVKLSDEYRQKPVVLVFGSYT